MFDRDFTNDDDLIGSLPLWPLFADGAGEGVQADTQLRGPDGQPAGVVSFGWRIVLTRELIEMGPRPSDDALAALRKKDAGRRRGGRGTTPR